MMEEAGIVTEKPTDDAFHVAIASASGCDLIVSWNFKHIVHFDKIPKYNAVNILNGYGQLGIYSPLEARVGWVEKRNPAYLLLVARVGCGDEGTASFA